MSESNVIHISFARADKVAITREAEGYYVTCNQMQSCWLFTNVVLANEARTMLRDLFAWYEHPDTDCAPSDFDYLSRWMMAKMEQPDATMPSLHHFPIELRAAVGAP